VLKPGGAFVCKYYSGGHDKELETGLKVAFEKVRREKPDSSRSVGSYLSATKLIFSVSIHWKPPY